MGYRTIKSADKLFAITNLSGAPVALSGAYLAAGASKEVSAWVYEQDQFRSRELYELVYAGKIEVKVYGAGYMGYVLSAGQIAGLEAPLPANVVTDYDTLANLNLGLNDQVPVGFLAYDTASADLVIKDPAGSGDFVIAVSP